MESKKELTIEVRIKKEYNKLKRLYKNIGKEKMSLVDGLIQNAAFMKITLDELQIEINENGVTEEYVHGKNQNGVKQSSAIQAYNATIKNYTATIKQLDSLPCSQGDKDDLNDF